MELRALYMYEYSSSERNAQINTYIARHTRLINVPVPAGNAKAGRVPDSRDSDFETR